MAAQSYCTSTTIKARAGITDSTDDTILGTIAGQVNSWLEGRIGFPVGPIASVERMFDGDAVRCVNGRYVLPCYPYGVRTVTAVTTAETTDGSETSRTASDVVLRPHSQDRETDWPAFELWVKDTATWTWPTSGLDVIGITGEWGWAAIPDELKGIAERLGVAAFRNRGYGAGSQNYVGDNIDAVAAEEMTGTDWKTIGKYQALRAPVG